MTTKATFLRRSACPGVALAKPIVLIRFSSPVGESGAMGPVQSSDERSADIGPRGHGSAPDSAKTCRV